MEPLPPASRVLVCQCFDSVITLILFGYCWELWIFQWIHLSWVWLISSMYYIGWQTAAIKYSRLYIELKGGKAEFYSWVSLHFFNLMVEQGVFIAAILLYIELICRCGNLRPGHVLNVPDCPLCTEWTFPALIDWQLHIQHPLTLQCNLPLLNINALSDI